MLARLRSGLRTFPIPRWLLIVDSLYVLALLLMAFFPVVWEMVLPADWKHAGLAVGVIAGVAGNLLANVLERWRHRDEGNRQSTPVVSQDTLVRLSQDAQAAARHRYLTGLLRTCQALPLAALGGDEDAEHDLTLDQVYIELDTATQVTRPDAASQPRRSESRLPTDREETQALSALDAARQCPRLALLGDPGSGKSTFVRLLVGRLARANLQVGPAPHGLAADCLPIFILLRDLASRLSTLDVATLAEQDRRQCLAEAVCQQAIDDLRRVPAEEFRDGLRQAMTSERCLLVLDGLDEVPQDLRQRVREAVGAVLSTYRPQRVIVTCRVRSYVQDNVLPAFTAHTLAPFADDKVQAFVRAWYKAQQELGRVDALQVESKAHDLEQAALSAELRELAANPMMLTTMSIIHQRETRLPHERVRLYSQAVEVLLRRWQRVKTGETLTTHPGLHALLADDNRLRAVVEGLAYEAHQSRQAGRAVTDLPRGAALTLLERPEYLGQLALADAFLEYVDQRAGLLVGQGGAPGQPTTYSFPHRTFQEYLAGCHVMDQRAPERVRDCFALTAAGDVWALAVQLGAEELLYNRRGLHGVMDLAYGLCASAQPADTQSRRAALWSGTLAALVGRDNIVRDTGRPGSGQAYLDRLVPCLRSLLGSDLTAPERADAGMALAHLGDPRFREEAWYLPAEPLLGLVEIPAGEFTLGSNDLQDQWPRLEARPAHPCALPMYYMARYLVTVGQFQAFVTASGYTPSREESLRGVANHPVVWVNWHDAMAYCDWLTACLRSWDETPEPIATLLRHQGWRVTLPSEAEWEKAARGHDRRFYPWGNAAPDARRANLDGAGIRGPSTVGCFPDGASPYGAEDMSGNVWEWTRSLEGTYPYPADASGRAQRENLQAAQDVPRVRRGGAFPNDHQLARCAYRFRLDAGGFDNHVGFRVALVAGLP